MRALIVVENDDKGVVTDRKLFIICEDKEQTLKLTSNLPQTLQNTLVNYIKSSFLRYKEKLLWEKMIIVICWLLRTN